MKETVVWQETEEEENVKDGDLYRSGRSSIDA